MNPISVLLLAVLPSVFADNVMHDPGIPHNEAVVYSLTVGDSVMTMTETTVCGSTGTGCEYTVTSTCPTDDKVITFRKTDMVATGYRHTWRNNGTIVKRTHALTREGEAYGTGDIPAIHYHCLPYVFRGFPFGERDRLDILMMGGDNPMRMYVESDGTATVETGAGPVACYKLKMGMPGFLGSVVPKSYYWYAVDAPHYMVKYEGSSGPPGSPKKTVLLQSYTVKTAE